MVLKTILGQNQSDKETILMLINLWNLLDNHNFFELIFLGLIWVPKTHLYMYVCGHYILKSSWNIKKFKALPHSLSLSLSPLHTQTNKHWSWFFYLSFDGTCQADKGSKHTRSITMDLRIIQQNSPTFSRGIQ